MLYDIKDELRKAIYDVAKLIGQEKQRVEELIKIFQEKVEIKFIQGLIDGTSHVAGTLPIIHFKEIDGEFKRICDRVVVSLPELQDTTNINHFRIDVRHEFFHAFANLLNADTVKLDLKNNKLSSNIGGKINERNILRLNEQNDSFTSVLFNEIVTDISAYCSYYPQLGISINEILNRNGLESINNTYSMGDGYRQLFPLGLCIMQAFSNYYCDYDMLSQNKYNAKYPSSGETIYYNDLLYGVLYNPLSIKELFIKYTSEEDWHNLEQIAKNIIINFKENNRSIKYEDMYQCLNLMAKYLNNKYNQTNNLIIKSQLARILTEFNIHYNKAIEYYSNLKRNQNFR